jgi:predicted aldo/keto reductase-like oxidoreductase
MDKVRLGRTNLMVSRSSFGALPIQRVSFDEAKRILLTAYENGMNFFDTARSYSDSEEKIAYALGPVRKNIIIATKTLAKDAATLNEQLAKSLNTLKTDYVDIYQLHNPPKLPGSEDADGLYAALVKAREKGWVRFVGISSHRQDVARGAVESGLYDTLQYPLNSLSDDGELKIVRNCRDKDIGFIAMKAMSGGLLSSCRSAFAFIRQFDYAVPIWGVQRESELKEVLEEIKKDRRELGGNFCRACGYCLPCPAQIPIPMAARMGLLLRRMPWQQFRSEEWQQNMSRIENCEECGHCREHCPYGLDTPKLLRQMLKTYREFLKNSKRQ